MLYNQSKDIQNTFYKDMRTGRPAGTTFVIESVVGLAYAGTHLDEVISGASDQVKKTYKEHGGYYVAGEVAAYIGEILLAQKLAGGAAEGNAVNVATSTSELLQDLEYPSVNS